MCQYHHRRNNYRCPCTEHYKKRENTHFRFKKWRILNSPIQIYCYFYIKPTHIHSLHGAECYIEKFIFPVFIAPRGPSPPSHKPALRLCTQLNQIHIFMPTIFRFSQVFQSFNILQPKYCIYCSLPPHMVHVLPMSSTV